MPSDKECESEMGKKRTKQNAGPSSNSRNSKGGHGYYSADSDDEVETCCSESDIQSVISQDEVSTELDQSTTDAAQEKFSDAINLLDSRTTSDREKALNYICSVLSSSYVPETLENWQETIASATLKCLSKGKKTEAKLAANLLLLLFVQMGGDRLGSSADDIRKGLLTASNNVNHSFEVRGRFLYILSLCSFFSLDTEEDETLMDNLETVICGTMRKEVVPLVALAFEAWSVLAIQFRPERVVQNYEKLLFRVLKIFEEFQENKELRLSAGKMVALIYENLNDSEERRKKFQKFDELYDLLTELSKQGGNVVGKRDKKAQKSSLREAIAYMDGETFKTEVIKFGKETLVMQSYSNYLLYESFKDFLGTGITRHLSLNPLVRDIFDLGDQNMAVCNVDRKTMKERMKGEFNENDKARTLYLRGKRGKRTDQGCN